MGPHSWGLNAPRAACVGMVLAAVSLSSRWVRASTQRKRRRKIKLLLKHFERLPLNECHGCLPTSVNENRDANNDISLTVLELFNVTLLWVLKPNYCPLRNQLRLARPNPRGCQLFLVHLSLMTGQQSGWRGNKKWVNLVHW